MTTIANRAASWWIDQILIPGDDAAIQRLGEVGAPVANLRARLAPTPEALERLQRALESVIVEKLRLFLRVEIRTDYEAQGLLYDLAKSSGVNPFAFPFKIRMIVKPDCITVNGKEIA